MGDLTVVVVVTGVDVGDFRTNFGDQVIGDGLGEDILILIAPLDLESVPLILFWIRIRGRWRIVLTQGSAGSCWLSVQGYMGKKNGRKLWGFTLILLIDGILGEAINTGTKDSPFALVPQRTQLLPLRASLLVLHAVQKVLRIHPDPRVRAILSISRTHSGAPCIGIGLIHRTQGDGVNRDKSVVSDDVNTIPTPEIRPVPIMNRLLDAIAKPQIMVSRKTGNELPASRVHRTVRSSIVPMPEEYLSKPVVFLLPELIPITFVALLGTGALDRRPFSATVEEVTQEEERVRLECRLYQ